MKVNVSFHLWCSSHVVREVCRPGWSILRRNNEAETPAQSERCKIASMEYWISASWINPTQRPEFSRFYLRVCSGVLLVNKFPLQRQHSVLAIKNAVLHERCYLKMSCQIRKIFSVNAK